MAERAGVSVCLRRTVPCQMRLHLDAIKSSTCWTNEKDTDWTCKERLEKKVKGYFY